MLKGCDNPSFSLRLGKRVFVCLKKSCLDNNLRERIKPFNIPFLACWTDRLSEAGES